MSGLGSKTALVTGASRGIGAAIAERFAREGYHVLAPSRREMDLSDLDSIKRFLRSSAKRRIDVLINNAAENKISAVERMPIADWQRILTTNLSSAFLLIQGTAPAMARRGWGRIVNLSSCYSFLARPGRAAYSASKSGLEALTRTAALEYGGRNVLVNAVCPGFVMTDMTRRNNPPAIIRRLALQTALKRLARPEEVAEAVFFLGSERNSYVTGQALIVDGGFSIQ